MDRLLLFTCFRFDPDSGSYVLAAWKIMRTGGLLTVVILAIGLFILWRRGSAFERRSTGPRVALGTSA
jgi:protein SCO1